MSTQPSPIPDARDLPGKGSPPRSVFIFLFALYLACVIASAVTRDFGACLDDKIHLRAMRVTFESGVLLPRTYHYPSLSYLFTLLAAVPSWAAQGFDRVAFARELGLALQGGLAEAPRAVLDARVLFAAFSYLAVFWAALLAWRLSHSRLAACAAALALALSFEFHYHARIMAPDAPMAQFVLLSVLFAHRYLASARRRDLIGAAVAAGLAAGTKFPGALALTAVGVAALAVEWSSSSAATRGRAILRVAGSCALALGVLGIVFLLTTPGVLFDTELMRQDVSMELKHYRAEGPAGMHAPYGVEAGWDHLRRLCVYIAAQGLSYSVPVALFLSALGFFGALQLARRDRIGAAVLFAVPLLYVSYFSYQRLMLVRNFEVLLPFVAVAVGLGAHAISGSKLPRLLRGGALLAVALALAWNVGFLVRADASILDRKQIDIAAELKHFVESSSAPLFVAPHAKELIDSRGEPALPPGRIALDAHAAQFALVLPSDLGDLVARPGFEISELRANWPKIYQPLPEGPWEVNFSYYPTWKGDARPLRITTEYYRALAGQK